MKRFLLATVAALALPLAAMAQTNPSMTTGTANNINGGASGGTATAASPNGITPPSPAAGAMSSPAASPAPMAATAPTASLSLQDTHFIRTAAIGGLAEVNDGQLAVTRGDSSVKSIGAKMVADHTAVNDQLIALAKAKGVNPPATVDAKHAAINVELKHLSGASFDHKYLSTELTGHEMTIAAFQAEASTGSDPQLKAFASNTLPKLEGHLAMIKSAIKSPST